MSNLLCTENKFWIRQEKARKNNQNFMKLSPDEVKLLLMTILAERELAAHLGQPVRLEGGR
jgi:hypothetical protein